MNANGIVDEFEKVRVLRRIYVIYRQPREGLSRCGIEAMPSIPTSDPSAPGDHLATVPIITKELNDTSHSASSTNVTNSRRIRSSSALSPVLIA